MNEPTGTTQTGAATPSHSTNGNSGGTASPVVKPLILDFAALGVDLSARAVDLAGIQKIIPHRHEMCLLDAIVWKPGWQETAAIERDVQERELCARPAWIIEAWLVRLIWQFYRIGRPAILAERADSAARKTVVVIRSDAELRAFLRRLENVASTPLSSRSA